MIFFFFFKFPPLRQKTLDLPSFPFETIQKICQIKTKLHWKSEKWIWTDEKPYALREQHGHFYRA